MRWFAICALVAGCFSPQPQPGQLCAADGTCPDGLVCSPATRTCERHAVAADATIEPPTDAPADAPVDAQLGPRLVQQKTNHAASSDSLSVTLAAPPATGDMLVMIGGTPTASLATVTGGGAT